MGHFVPQAIFADPCSITYIVRKKQWWSERELSRLKQLSETGPKGRKARVVRLTVIPGFCLRIFSKPWNKELVLEKRARRTKRKEWKDTVCKH